VPYRCFFPVSPWRSFLFTHEQSFCFFSSPLISPPFCRLLVFLLLFTFPVSRLNILQFMAQCTAALSPALPMSCVITALESRSFDHFAPQLTLRWPREVGSRRSSCAPHPNLSICPPFVCTRSFPLPTSKPLQNHGLYRFRSDVVWLLPSSSLRYRQRPCHFLFLTFPQGAPFVPRQSILFSTLSLWPDPSNSSKSCPTKQTIQLCPPPCISSLSVWVVIFLSFFHCNRLCPDIFFSCPPKRICSRPLFCIVTIARGFFPGGVRHFLFVPCP